MLEAEWKKKIMQKTGIGFGKLNNCKNHVHLTKSVWQLSDLEFQNGVNEGFFFFGSARRTN